MAKDKATKAEKVRTIKCVTREAAKAGKGEGPSASQKAKEVDVRAKTAGPAPGGKGEGPSTSSTKKKLVPIVDKDDGRKTVVKILVGLHSLTYTWHVQRDLQI